MKRILCILIISLPFVWSGCSCNREYSSPLGPDGPLIGVFGDGMVIEIAGNGIDDNGNGTIDEKGSIEVNSQITTSGDHASMIKPFYAAGKLADSVDMGSLHWSQTSGDTNPDTGDWDNSFGEHDGEITPGTNIHEYNFYYTNNTVSWHFNVPEPGYYVLSFFSWSSDERRITPSYNNGSDILELPDSNHNTDLYLVYFHSAGEHRINAFGNNNNYLFHSHLFYIRRNPESEHTAHPRISVNPDTINDFRDTINNTWISRMTENCISDADGMLANPDLDAFSEYSPRGHQGQLLDLAVAYIATGAAKYARYGIDALYRVLQQPHFMGGPSWSYLGIGEYIMAISICYDYFHDAMSDDERTELLQLADMHINYLYLHSLNSRHRGDGSHWWSAKSSNNWNAVINGGGLGLAALCFEDDNNYADDWYDLAVKTQEYFLEYNFDDGGAYTESFMYLEYATGSASLFYKSLLENKGVELIHHNDNAFLKSVRTAMYFWEPNKQTTSPFNQEDRWGLDWSYRYVFLRPSWFTAASVYNDGIIQKYLRHSYGDEKINDRYHDYAYSIPLCVLGYDAVEETPYAEWDIPLSKTWPGFGKTVMRSGFEDINDYYFALECGIYGSHGHADQSSFIIHALGHVLADDNYYDNTDSEFQNIILVDGTGQAQSSWDVFAGSTNYFIDTSILDFVSVESSPGYIENGIDINYNRRNVLFIEPSAYSNGYYIIADHIAAASSHSFQWGIHRQTLGPDITNQGSDNYLFDGDEADLEIRFASPESTSYDITDDKLTVIPPGNSDEEHFTVLLYPTDTTHVIPAVTKINTDDFAGFSLVNDLVLYNKTKMLNAYSNVTTDAELSFSRTAGGNTYLALFRGQTLSAGGYGIQLGAVSSAVCSIETGHVRLDVGDQVAVTGNTTVSLSGLTDGSYSYSLDGADQGSVVISGGTFEETLPIIGQHTIVLTLP